MNASGCVPRYLLYASVVGVIAYLWIAMQLTHYAQTQANELLDGSFCSHVSKNTNVAQQCADARELAAASFKQALALHFTHDLKSLAQRFAQLPDALPANNMYITIQCVCVAVCVYAYYSYQSNALQQRSWQAAAGGVREAFLETVKRLTRARQTFPDATPLRTVRRFETRASKSANLLTQAR